MNKPLISVITVTFNSENTIEESIQSLHNQTYENYEHIVIDGASKDNTTNILDRYKDSFSYFISEPDDGISDAWNKGINASKGELIIFLNSDDIFHKNTLELAYLKYINSDKRSIIYGKCSFFNDKGIIGVNNKTFVKEKIESGLGFGFVHTTCFVPKVIYDELGGFNTKYKIAIDTDFLVRAYKKGFSFLKGTHQVYMREGGVSDAFAKRAYFEYLTILGKHHVLSINKIRRLKFMYSLYSPLRPFRKSNFIINILRFAKHFIFRLVNFTHNLLPSFLFRKAFLKMLGFKLGEKSFILKGCVFYSFNNILIGDNVVVNRDCTLDNRGEILIGNNVSISHNTRIYTGSHDVYSGFFDYITKPVQIGNNVSIFSNVIILPGTKIDDDVVVSSGSVVYGVLEKGCLYAGNPAVKVEKNFLQKDV